MSSLVSIADIMPAQSNLFESSRTVALTPEVESMLAAGAAVAVGVSGGKDSVACALAVARHLESISYTGPRILITADLGRIEWEDSISSCRRLAAHLGWELVVVRRKAGDMIARWETRWENNVSRYANLEMVKLLHPFSSSVWRFCTSELKVAPITSELRRRFPSLPILNVTGIRWQESTARSKMPIYAVSDKLSRKGLAGAAWNAIIDWRIENVFDEISQAGLQLHEAYTRYRSSRVSCSFCILSSESDLRAASTCESNHESYRLIVNLEALSGFAFQGNRWLADTAPHILSEETRERIVTAKRINVERQAIESRIPDHLLYVKGWPHAVPNRSDAELLADVRKQVAALSGIQAGYLTADSIIGRYEELLAEKAAKKQAA